MNTLLVFILAIIANIIASLIIIYIFRNEELKGKR
jgi:hypothetical protein